MSIHSTSKSKYKPLNISQLTQLTENDAFIYQTNGNIIHQSLGTSVFNLYHKNC